MNKRQANKQIDTLLTTAAGVAIDWIEQEARKIMLKHNFTKFYMGDGYVFFERADGTYVMAHEVSYCESLNDFLIQWDANLKLDMIPFSIDNLK